MVLPRVMSGAMVAMVLRRMRVTAGVMNGVHASERQCGAVARAVCVRVRVKGVVCVQCACRGGVRVCSVRV